MEEEVIGDNMENHENLDLRKAVAEALGCKAVIRKPYIGHNLYVFCECKDRLNSHSWPDGGKHLVKSYELDHRAALDALMEFCEKYKYKWEISFMVTNRYSCAIWKYAPGPHAELVSDGFNDRLAPAICEAIVEAAQKSEKEAGE